MISPEFLLAIVKCWISMSCVPLTNWLLQCMCFDNCMWLLSQVCIIVTPLGRLLLQRHCLSTLTYQSIAKLDYTTQTIVISAACWQSCDCLRNKISGRIYFGDSNVFNIFFLFLYLGFRVHEQMHCWVTNSVHEVKQFY